MFHFISMMTISFSIIISLPLTGQKTLPDVKLVDINGTDVQLGSYLKNGKPKVVNLWATWCGPCRMELNELKGEYAKWQQNYGLEIIAVNVDNPSMAGRAKKMFETNAWPFVYLHDKNQDLIKELKIQGIPYSVLLDGQGNIQSVQTGFYAGYTKDMEEKLKNLKK